MQCLLAPYPDHHAIRGERISKNRGIRGTSIPASGWLRPVLFVQFCLSRWQARSAGGGAAPFPQVKGFLLASGSEQQFGEKQIGIAMLFHPSCALSPVGEGGKVFIHHIDGFVEKPLGRVRFSYRHFQFGQRAVILELNLVIREIFYLW